MRIIITINNDYCIYLSVFYLILTLNLILVVPVQRVWRSSRCGGPGGMGSRGRGDRGDQGDQGGRGGRGGQGGATVPGSWRLNPVVPVTRSWGHAVLGPVNLLSFYMFRLISLSGFLHDSNNLAKLFNRCNSILSKTDHFTLSF